MPWFEKWMNESSTSEDSTNGTITQWWWEHNLLYSLKDYLAVSQKVKHTFTMHTSNSTPIYLATRAKTYVYKKSVQKFSEYFYFIKSLKALQIFNMWIDKYVYLYTIMGY